MVNRNDIPGWEYDSERRLRDHMTWKQAYTLGYREPNYSVPSVISDGDVTIFEHCIVIWKNDGSSARKIWFRRGCDEISSYRWK